MSKSFSELVTAADLGDSDSVREVFASLYTELHVLAESHLRRQSDDFSLGTTTLVHDAYLQMSSRSPVAFPDKARFFAYASLVMRGLVIDRVRRRLAFKRGGGFQFTTLSNAPIAVSAADESPHLDALTSAMDHLTQIDPALAELVDLHFFCGFSFVEIAQLRGVSERTAQRDWRKARLLLAAQLDAVERATVPAGGNADDPAFVRGGVDR
jgi:RNA polymerase sigma factor (TIGR02999 family)